jgi:hypothetical protein
MTAATQDRATRIRLGDEMAVPVKAATKIYAGTMVALGSDGYARPARATSTDIVIGIAEALADNTSGADGDINVTVRRRVAGAFANSLSGDAITLTERGKTVFVVDDSTVAKTNNAGARPAAGVVIDVDAQGVWVQCGGSAQADLIVAGIAAGYKVARGQHVMLSADDVVVTGLATVVSVEASLESDPVLTCDRVSAALGDQAGAPAAGSVHLKAWMPTDATHTTPIAATGFAGIKVNWFAIGV